MTTKIGASLEKQSNSIIRPSLFKGWMKGGNGVDALELTLSFAKNVIDRKLSSFELKRFTYLKTHLKNIDFASCSSEKRQEFSSFFPEFKHCFSYHSIPRRLNKHWNGTKTSELDGDGYLSQFETSLFKSGGVLGSFKDFSDDGYMYLNQFKEKALPRLQKEKLNWFVEFFSESAFKLSMDPHLLHKIESILGENVLLVRGDLFTIPGYSYSGALHKDMESRLWRRPDDSDISTAENMVNVWIGLSGSDENTATLRFFPQTHLEDQLFPSDTMEFVKNSGADFDMHCRYLSLEDPPVEFSRYLFFHSMLSSQRDSLKNTAQLLSITEPNDYIMFDSDILHGGPYYNNSPNPRVSMVFKYCAASERAVKRPSRFMNDLSKHYSADEISKISNNSLRLEDLSTQVLGSKMNDVYEPIDKNSLCDYLVKKKFH
ncbi:hypothetical protein HOG98_08485 [bacterium]|jgi:hypothetical protein|nr:hypothetical protein [bacterium]